MVHKPDVIYGTKVIIHILIAHVPNDAIKALLFLWCIRSAPCTVLPPSPGTESYFFNVITADINEDG